MKYKAILFDLDGTLLPMDNDVFTMGYLSLLHKELEPYGYGKEEFVGAMWSGVAAMVKNGTDKLNSECFWEVFSALLGEKVLKYVPKIDAFYGGEFEKAKAFTSPTSLAREAVDAARAAAGKVVLATNPFFPEVAVRKRIEWAGLEWEDFDLVTFYDNSTRCKPNPEYYVEIAKKIGVDVTECLMIGNNADEDIRAAQAVGMETYLVTDCLIAKGETPETQKGSFADAVEFLKSL